MAPPRTHRPPGCLDGSPPRSPVPRQSAVSCSGTTACGRWPSGHPTWSAAQIHAKVGQEAPSPRTIQRLRHRYALPRLPKRPVPCRPARRLTRHVKQEARQLIEAKPWLGRNGWPGNSRTWARCRSVRDDQAHEARHAAGPDAAPPAPTWRFYARHHSHSLWHGDCLEKVFDQATGSNSIR